MSKQARSKLTPLSLSFLLLSVSISACTKAPAKESIDITNAYIPVRNNTQMHFAAYFDIHNKRKQTITLQSVSSEQFNSVSLHETRLENGMSKMRPLNNLEIKSGESVSLAPNGKHLMLMQATESIASRDTITVQLHFADGTLLKHSIPLRKKSP